MSCEKIIKLSLNDKRTFILTDYFERGEGTVIMHRSVHIDEFPMVYVEVVIKDSAIESIDSATEEEACWYIKMIDKSVPVKDKYSLEIPSSLVVISSTAEEIATIEIEIPEVNVSNNPVEIAENSASIVNENDTALIEERNSRNQRIDVALIVSPEEHNETINLEQTTDENEIQNEEMIVEIPAPVVEILEENVDSLRVLENENNIDNVVVGEDQKKDIISADDKIIEGLNQEVGNSQKNISFDLEEKNTIAEKETNTSNVSDNKVTSLINIVKSVCNNKVKQYTNLKNHQNFTKKNSKQNYESNLKYRKGKKSKNIFFPRNTKPVSTDYDKKMKNGLFSVEDYKYMTERKDYGAVINFNGKRYGTLKGIMEAIKEHVK